MVKVYMYTNIINNKKYVGITNRTLKERLKVGYSGRFKNAINKYGIENFKTEIVAEFETREEAENLEIELIRDLNLTNDKFGYNIALGGDGGNTRIGMTKEELEEYSKKLSQSRTGEKNPNYGKGLHGAKNGRAKGVQVKFPNGEVVIFQTQKECRQKLNIGLDMFVNTLRSGEPLKLPDAVKDKRVIERYENLQGIIIKNIA